MFPIAHCPTPRFRVTPRDLPNCIQDAFLFYFFCSLLSIPELQAFFSACPGFALNLTVAFKSISFILLEENRVVPKYLIPALLPQSMCIPLNNVTTLLSAAVKAKGLRMGEAERQDLCRKERNREGKKEQESRYGDGHLRVTSLSSSSRYSEAFGPWEISIFQCFLAFCSECLVF